MAVYVVVCDLFQIYLFPLIAPLYLLTASRSAEPSKRYNSQTRYRPAETAYGYRSAQAGGGYERPSPEPDHKTQLGAADTDVQSRHQ